MHCVLMHFDRYRSLWWVGFTEAKVNIPQNKYAPFVGKIHLCNAGDRNLPSKLP